MTTERVLDVEGIDVAYGPSPVLHGVSCHADAGETVAVLGRNGAGKTTLVRAIMGLTPPARGHVRVGGADVTGERPSAIANRGVGYVPQNRRMFRAMTVRENLEMGAGRGALDPDRLEYVYDLFPRLRERTGQRAGTLSGGEQQLVAIARALVRDPALLVMDEPTEGLMPSLVDEIAATVEALSADGYTTLLVSQNVDLALDVADRVYLLERGRVEHEATAASLRADPSPIDEHLGIGLGE